MGECISLVAKLSQILAKDGLGSAKNIRSETVEGERRGLNPKLIINVEKSANFDKMTENLVLKQWFSIALKLWRIAYTPISLSNT